MSIENPFMLEDRVPTPYSLTFELPPTDNNLAVFNYPNRVGSYSRTSEERSVEAAIIFQSIKIAVGRLILVNFDVNLKVNFSGIDFNSQLKDKLFKIPMGQVDFEGTYTNVNWELSTNYAYQYRQWAKNNAYGSDNRFVLAPISRNNANIPFGWWEESRRSDIRTLKVDVKRILRNYYYNAFNPQAQDFYFTDSSRKAHAPILPQFRVGYLFSQIVPSLANNPFAVGDFNNIVVPSYWHPNIEYTQTDSPLVSKLKAPAYLYPDGPPYIALSEFLPNLDANIFVKEILKLFCHTLYSKDGGYNIKSNTSILAAAATKDWTPKVIGQTPLQYDQLKIYEYGYTNEKRIYEGGATPVTVATINDMVNRTFSLSDGEYEQLFFVQETKQYFLKIAYNNKYREGNTEGEELIVDYEFQGYAPPAELVPEDENQSKYNAKSDIIFPDIYPTVFFTSLNNLKTTKYWMAVPRHFREEGSNSEVRPSRVVKRETGFELLMYAGSKPVATSIGGTTYNYPYLSPYGNTALSFDWEGTNGLVSKFHKQFKDWVERDKLKMNAVMLLSALDISKMDITEKIHVKGRNFFIQKLQFNIRRDRIDPASIDLIEA